MGAASGGWACGATRSGGGARAKKAHQRKSCRVDRLHAAQRASDCALLQRERSGRFGRVRSGRPPKLASDQEQAFCDRLDAGATDVDAVTTLHGWNIQRILKDEFKADYSLNGVYGLLHRMNYSWLMPRPQHEQADAQAQEDFKKTLMPRSQRLRPSIPTNASKCGSRTKRVSASRAR